MPARPASSSRAPASRQRAAWGTGNGTISPGAFDPSAPAKARRSSRVRYAVASSATATTAGRVGGRSPARASDAAEPHSPSSRIRSAPRANATRAGARSPQASSVETAAVTSVAIVVGSLSSPGPLAEVEGQILELDRQVDVLETHVLRHLDAARGEVEDRPHPGRDQPVGDSLGGLRGDRDDTDLDRLGLHDARQLGYRLDREPVYRPPDLGGVVVNDGHDPETLARETAVVEERGAEIAEPDQDHPPLAVEPEDALDLGTEVGRVVADPSNAELSEVREILPDLGRVQVKARGKLLRGDRLDAVLLELRQAAEVDGQAPDSHLRNAGQATSGTRHAVGEGRPRRAGRGGPLGRPPSYLTGFARSRMIAMPGV